MPPLTLALIMIMIVVYAGSSLLPAAIERWIVFHFAFIPISWSIQEWPLWSKVIAPFTYAFLHGGLMHIALNAVMLAVMGQVLERRLGRPKFFLVFAVGAIAGALVHALIGGAAEVPLVGASAGVGALYGAGLVFYGRGVNLGPNGRILMALTAFFVITNLVGLALPIFGHVAYAAHLGGFIAGILLTASIERSSARKRF